MLKESSKVKELRTIREKLLKESLDFRDELFNEIWEKFNISFYVSFNDLYSVKGGECRRLKGWMSSLNDDVMGSLNKESQLKRNNEKFNKLKNYLNNKDFGKYKVDICKLGGLNFNYYKNYWVVREENWGKDWFDYKNEMLYNETCLVIKIKWKGINLNRVLNEIDGGVRKISKYDDGKGWVWTGEYRDLKRVV